MRASPLREDFPPACRLCLDTSPLIYHLEDVEPYASLTAQLLIRLGEGDLTGLLSVVTVTELLAKPFTDPEERRAALAEQFLLTLPNCSLVPVTYRIAKEAARLRALHGLRTPDALVAATALEEGASHLVTNDAVFRRIASDQLKVILLDDLVSPAPPEGGRDAGEGRVDRE